MKNYGTMVLGVWNSEESLCILIVGKIASVFS